MASPRNHKANFLQGCLLAYFPAIIVLGLAALLLLYNAAESGALISFRPASGKIAGFFAPSVQHWGADLEAWSASYELDANLVATVMQIESCGDPRAVSSAGAAGLFQVMPFHFEPGEDPTDPHTNARRGLDYLKQSLEAAGGDVRLALAGYNGGIGVIGQPESAWPEETQRYAEWGYRMYLEAASGVDSSATLRDWLSSGGSALCRQAAQSMMLRLP